MPDLIVYLIEDDSDGWKCICPRDNSRAWRNLLALPKLTRAAIVTGRSPDSRSNSFLKNINRSIFKLNNKVFFHNNSYFKIKKTSLPRFTTRSSAQCHLNEFVGAKYYQIHRERAIRDQLKRDT